MNELGGYSSVSSIFSERLALFRCYGGANWFLPFLRRINSTTIESVIVDMSRYPLAKETAIVLHKNFYTDVIKPCQRGKLLRSRLHRPIALNQNTLIFGQARMPVIGRGSLDSNKYGACHFPASYAVQALDGRTDLPCKVQEAIIS